MSTDILLLPNHRLFDVLFRINGLDFFLFRNNAFKSVGTCMSGRS